MFEVGEYGLIIGGVEVSNRVFLAPMEDVSNIAFRRIVKQIANPGLMFTEFVSAMAIHHNPARSVPKMRVHPSERPLGIQIFGADVSTMAESARIAEAEGADIVDINMGCWVPKVCRTGSGAALLKDPVLAEQIVRAVSRAVAIPVTVKVRAGWESTQFAAPDLGRRFVDAGAQMITLHARFARQGFHGDADWELIRKMKQAVTVPVVGNGDVRRPEDARKMRVETGCDAVMVGRAAIGNPWALRDVVDFVSERSHRTSPAIGERIRTALQHIRWMIAAEAGVDEYDEARESAGFEDAEIRACRALRGQIPLYIKGEIGAAAVRDQLTKCSSLAEYEGVLDRFASQVCV